MKAVAKYRLPIAVTLFVAFLLGMMEIKMEVSMLAIDRFLPGFGWIQILILALYGGFLAYKMQDAGQSSTWRKRSWLLFSIVFFTQFALGIVADERFLMSGKLHLPVPFMIAAGPIYRAQMTIMPILLLSSIVLTGPAWCSHYCYFGAWDQVFAGAGTGVGQKNSGKGQKAKGKRQIAKGKGQKAKGKGLKIKDMMVPLKGKWIWKSTFLVIVVLAAWIFRMFGFSGWQTLGPALGFGFIGIGIMFFVSRRRHKMAHCVSFCPIGTIVNLGKHVSPFRMKIESSCTNCLRCIPTCPYDALNLNDIKAGKPGLTCTLCGDCVTSCEVSAIQYRFLQLNPRAARNLYLFLTISVHVLCMGLARI